jgi:hypothetical protein
MGWAVSESTVGVNLATRAPSPDVLDRAAGGLPGPAVENLGRCRAGGIGAGDGFGHRMLRVVGAAPAGTVWGHCVTGRVLLLSACDCAVAVSAPAASRRLDAFSVWHGPTARKHALPLDHNAGQGAGDAVHDLDPGGHQSAQLIQTGRLNPGDDVVGAGEILGRLHTI